MMLPDLVGQTIGKYRILDEIGRGGMAVVYRALDTSLDRPVAIKVLAPHLAWNAEFVQRFLHEARAVARLDHPHIVKVYEVGELGTQPFLVMQYIQGRPLSELIREGEPWEPGQVVGLLGQVASALDYAHGEGIIHRDIKPGNILVDERGWATLTDFGLARALNTTRLTQTGAVLGTPAYMSPEQARGQALTPASDLYSLGVVAYELLTGYVPFQADSPPALLVAHIQTPPRPLREFNQRVPAALEPVVRKALAKQPTARHHNAAEFTGALKAAIRQPTTAPLSPTPRPSALPWPLLAGVAALAFVLVLVLGLSLARKAPNPTPTQQAGQPGGGGVTATSPATQRPPLTATPTRDTRVMAKVTTEYGLLLRVGPALTYPQVAPLPWGAEVTVLAQAEGGQWLLVRTDAGQTGWMAGGPEYVLLSGPLDGIPVATATETPTPTPEPSATPTETAPPPPPPVCAYNARFVADVQPVDNAVIQRGMGFTKTWRVQNNGNCPWTPDFRIVYQGGEMMGSAPAVPLAITIGVQETTTISVNLTAPTVAGNHTGTWRIQNEAGVVFGEPLIVSINVPMLATSTPRPSATATRARPNPPAAPSQLSVSTFDSGCVDGGKPCRRFRATWRDNSNNEEGFLIRFEVTDGWLRNYQHVKNTTSLDPFFQEKLKCQLGEIVHITLWAYNYPDGPPSGFVYPNPDEPGPTQFSTPVSTTVRCE